MATTPAGKAGMAHNAIRRLRTKCAGDHHRNTPDASQPSGDASHAANVMLDQVSSGAHAAVSYSVYGSRPHSSNQRFHTTTIMLSKAIPQVTTEINNTAQPTAPLAEVDPMGDAV